MAMLTIGQQIRTARQDRDLTQQQLADLIGVSKQAVWDWESENYAVDSSHFAKVEEVLGIRLILPILDIPLMTKTIVHSLEYLQRKNVKFRRLNVADLAETIMQRYEDRARSKTDPEELEAETAQVIDFQIRRDRA